ncbi:uncharacterized protein A1O9_06401 [Exophiala aquamarina CBS 119918]|uniref:Cytochrome P450 oxidoreductase n=1 Tax=Exophiala aquamarina CBS 119918 TaxID=1182545 RepID=A0A072PSH1_9EURO|nr:uncharacterized protein A1O9_06401 [Exophiala aquamarina CBS 119918]KEF58475.1 hypothetical protein A1O9_06401 [Exophiala aquamarina CBS 119918]
MILPLLIYSLPFFLLIILFKNQSLLPSTIPGPLIARFTNLYRAFLVYQRSPHEVHLQLHKQHGPLVRLGPNVVSVSGSARYIAQIYGIGKGLVKSDFYSCFQNIVNGRRAASLVAITDETEHAKSKRLVAHAYSLSTLVEYEGLVDQTVDVFLTTLEDQFTTTATKDNDTSSTPAPVPVLDLGRYLQFFAFDVIGELTFSRRLGFIESGADVDSIIAAIGANFEYFSVLGQIPWLDEALLGKNPLYVRYFRKSVSSPILQFAQARLKERLRDIEEGRGDEKNSLDRPDFLSRFLKVRQEEVDGAEAMNDLRILSYLFANINAGSDTLASTLRAILYHLLRNQASQERLITELASAAAGSKISAPCPTWNETQQQLPYLCAVIKEGLRLNPALSLPLERVVPQDGLQLSHEDGATTFLPAGTIVGINPWVLHRSPGIFGPDAEEWSPERWLTEHEQKTKTMEHALLAFGAGKRSCLGKNIAMLELHKVVAALFLKFDVELDDPAREWVVSNAWALNQTGLLVRLKVR